MVKFAAEQIFQQANSNVNQQVFGSIILNVKAYGAKGDGINDDTASIQKTINAAVVTSGQSGIIYFPPGKYMITGLTIPNGSSLIGAGSGHSIINGIDTTTPLLTFTNDLSGVVVEGLRLTRTTAGAVGAHGIYGNATGARFLFNNLWIDKQDSGIYLPKDVAGAWITNVFVQNCSTYGVRISYPNMVLNGVYSNFNGSHGFYFDKGTGGLYMIHCEAFSNAGTGVMCSPLNPPTDAINDVVITQLISGFNAGYGLYLDTNGENIMVNDSYIEYSGANSAGTIVAANDGILITSKNKRVDINNTISVFNGGTGLNIQCNNVKVNGGVYSTNSLKTTGGAPGVNIAANVKRTIINGISSCKYIADGAATQSYGVQFGSGCDEFLVVNNDLKDNLTSAVYLDPGIGTKGKVSNNVGYNPLGLLSPQPTLPASGTAYTNKYSVLCDVYVYGGTVTGIYKNGTGISGMTSGTVRLDPGETILITYSVAPSWTWFGS